MQSQPVANRLKTLYWTKNDDDADDDPEWMLLYRTNFSGRERYCSRASLIKLLRALALDSNRTILGCELLSIKVNDTHWWGSLRAINWNNECQIIYCWSNFNLVSWGYNRGEFLFHYCFSLLVFYFVAVVVRMVLVVVEVVFLGDQVRTHIRTDHGAKEEYNK